MKRFFSDIIKFTIISCFYIICGCSVNSLFYLPNHVLYQIPIYPYEDVTFFSKDGTELNGWFIPAKGTPWGTVIFFHGNASNISSHYTFVRWLTEKGFNLFLFDYRGYGKSEGCPDRRGIYEDSVSAIEYVQSRKDIDPDKLLILGQSLGGANAISAVGNNHFKGIRAVVIEASFFSYTSIAKDRLRHGSCLLPSISADILLNDEFSPGRVVDKISPIPILFIHGTADDVVPFHHSQWLFEKAGNPKQLWMIENGRHVEAFTRYGKVYQEKVVEFYIDSIYGYVPADS